MIANTTLVRFVRIWNNLVRTESNGAYVPEERRIILNTMPGKPNMSDPKITDQYAVIDNVIYNVSITGNTVSVTGRRPIPNRENA